ALRDRRDGMLLMLPFLVREREGPCARRPPLCRRALLLHALPYAGEPSLPRNVVYRRRVDGLRPAGTRPGARRRVLPLRPRGSGLEGPPGGREGRARRRRGPARRPPAPGKQLGALRQS